MPFDLKLVIEKNKTLLFGLLAIAIAYFFFAWFKTARTNSRPLMNLENTDLKNPMTDSSIDSDTSDKVLFIPDNDNPGATLAVNADYYTANEMHQFPYKELETNVVNEMYTSDVPLFDNAHKQPMVTPDIESSQRRVNFYEM
jgi:hypothetical protein